ncbi:MAG TPA: B12-binding domain-containing radical SAM protein [Planctomycetaceae bacterium]|nr:B12-binding domain-containing radical SAM protein [Planctomycetaceae bacterium]
MIQQANPQLPVLSASDPSSPVHPLGRRAKVLLTSVFGPYAQDDEFGSRVMNPMELYHNQVTRTQGPFSLRMFHRSWGLMLIQANIDAPCVVLDFPVLDRFVQELRENRYDVIGISSIIPNLGKVKKMCELIRQYQPHATIVVGGHVANLPDLPQRIDADHCVKGEGVRWFRRFLGEDENRPIRHPLIKSGIGTRTAGITVKEGPGDVAATVIPSVGCPLGCNFCSTSAMFGGKGKFINFYETGDELFHVMCQMEEQMQSRSFFMMDENFLLHQNRARRLLELMREHDKAWSLDVFSSANVLRKYSMDELLGLGISWVWMGMEGKESQYTKLHGIDVHELVKELQANGIRVLGSTIIGLENHTPDNIDEAIDYAASYATDFHQFMLYTPIAGTPLHAELTAKGLMKDDSEFCHGDIHGQLVFNYRHPHIKNGQEGEFMIRAFDRDFAVNGPSTARIVRTTLAGWKRHKNNPDRRIARRIAWDARELATTFSALVGTARRYYRDNPVMWAKMDALLKELHAEFGWKSRFFSTVGSWYVMPKIRREEKRLAEGWTYEPPTFYERNEHCTDRPELPTCRACKPLNRPVEPTATEPPRPAFRKPAATPEPSSSALVG